MHKTFLAIAAAAIALQGCAPQQTPAQIAAEQFNEGVAKTCDASTLQVAPGSTTNATISMTNDGWCAVRATSPTASRSCSDWSAPARTMATS